MGDRTLFIAIIILGLIISNHDANASTTILPSMSTSILASSSQNPSSSLSSTAISSSITATVESSSDTTVPTSTSKTTSSSTTVPMSTSVTTSSIAMTPTASSMTTSSSTMDPTSSSMKTASGVTTTMVTSSTMSSSSLMTSSISTSPSTHLPPSSTIAPSSRVITPSSSTSSSSTAPTTNVPPNPGPTLPSVENPTEESEFGRVGLVAFGIMFAIAVILAMALILLVWRNKRQSGAYLTNESTGTRRMMDGPPMTFGMDNGGFDNVHTIDLDKDDRNFGKSAGITSFSTQNENEIKGEKVTDAGATNQSNIKFADAGSINNLLNDNDSNKDHSDDESDKEDISNLIGLKVEPSTGASVEGLGSLKETDKLMSDEDQDSDNNSIDNNLPSPDISEDEEEAKHTDI